MDLQASRLLQPCCVMRSASRCWSSPAAQQRTHDSHPIRRPLQAGRAKLSRCCHPPSCRLAQMEGSCSCSPCGNHPLWWPPRETESLLCSSRSCSLGLQRRSLACRASANGAGAEYVEPDGFRIERVRMRVLLELPMLPTPPCGLRPPPPCLPCHGLSQQEQTQEGCCVKPHMQGLSL